MWEERLKLYDSFVTKCARFDRLGKTMPYTSTNGYMFSLLNKNAELGIRFSKEVQETYFKKFDTTIYKSYGAVMKGYILITEAMLTNETLILDLLNESYDYFNSIEPNKHKK
ncbi:hypothetical protein [Patiriisocius hiemis]|uniref:Uncharacterized protein n=1 Tax=Patiriisocius hiemis TaxID=3075604 RepID=A0ABU2YAR2_9FLAO|nr:hypothetical protein [Constantimarinum sp. W242]MDT0555278.1 hypothetical protein [Constantimarinum sp. W242]